VAVSWLTTWTHTEESLVVSVCVLSVCAALEVTPTVINSYHGYIIVRDEVA